MVLERAGIYPRYLSSGQLVYVNKGSLFGISFDADRLEVRGAPAKLGDVANTPTLGSAQYNVSRSGTLAYQTGSTEKLRIIQSIVVLANSDLIDKLGVAVFPSIPTWAPVVRSLDRVSRFLPESGHAATQDPRAPPSTRRPTALREATETNADGSITLGLAMRRLGRLAIQHLHRQSVDRHRLASERLSSVLGVEDPTW
jgi:hypothetical protein